MFPVATRTVLPFVAPNSKSRKCKGPPKGMPVTVALVHPPESLKVAPQSTQEGLSSRTKSKFPAQWATGGGQFKEKPLLLNNCCFSFKLGAISSCQNWDKLFPCFLPSECEAGLPCRDLLWWGHTQETVRSQLKKQNLYAQLKFLKCCETEVQSWSQANPPWKLSMLRDHYKLN